MGNNSPFAKYDANTYFIKSLLLTLEILRAISPLDQLYRRNPFCSNKKTVSLKI